VTITVRGPTGALAAIDTMAVSTVPSGLATGPTPTVMPIDGTSETDCASWNVLPRMVSVTSLPGVLKIGSIESICGGVRTTFMRSASGAAGRNAPADPVTTTLRCEIGALAAMVSGTETELPSGATVSAPTVTPVLGITATDCAVCNPAPEIVIVVGPVP